MKNKSLEQNVEQILANAKLVAELKKAAPLHSTLHVKASQELEKAVAEDLELEDRPLRDLLKNK
jgi:hypothetical protein